MNLWTDRILAAALSILFYVVATVVAWIKFTEEVKKDVQQLLNWQEKQTVRTEQQESQIVDLRIMAAEQRKISENIMNRLDRILDYIDRNGKKL